jgi:hypothetical protein
MALVERRPRKNYLLVEFQKLGRKSVQETYVTAGFLNHRDAEKEMSWQEMFTFDTYE